jgi:F420-non-reducing hydrogenase iron-sulfur subunit
MDKNFTPKITLFHCINAFTESGSMCVENRDGFEVKTVKMACSSMTKDVFMLRAFEAGADAVVVLVCPEGQCRYVEGNIRAKKRVKWVKDLMDEIGIDGRRLSIFNVSSQDEAKTRQIIDDTIKDLDELGPNPAA